MFTTLKIRLQDRKWDNEYEQSGRQKSPFFGSPLNKLRMARLFTTRDRCESGIPVLDDRLSAIASQRNRSKSLWRDNVEATQSIGFEGRKTQVDALHSVDVIHIRVIIIRLTSSGLPECLAKRRVSGPSPEQDRQFLGCRPKSRQESRMQFLE
jgi:hypothetical protein